MKKAKIVHALNGDDNTFRHAFLETLCGKSILGTTPATKDPTKVTCKPCLKRLSKPQA
jgi:hypothetical protein